MPRKVIEYDTPTTTPEPVELELPNGEVFAFAPQCPAGVLIDLSKVSQDSAVDVYLATLEALAIGDTAERVRTGLRSAERPITVELLGKMIEALVEEYSDRPTSPSDDSSPSPSPDGSTSTVAAPSEASTPEPSPSTVS